ncbi:hypothetical protein Taro_036371 [Colocasia esculenta]|uniref:Uncharacterized protein n=1 Tax=Colocasia esculenta TaxID=4460 RepID=A0A843WG53_COLES|nr:hypothetical protein [Colocasia esculenta]
MQRPTGCDGRGSQGAYKKTPRSSSLWGLGLGGRYVASENFGELTEFSFVLFLLEIVRLLGEWGSTEQGAWLVKLLEIFGSVLLVLYLPLFREEFCGGIRGGLLPPFWVSEDGILRTSKDQGLLLICTWRDLHKEWNMEIGLGI